jgi:hypothetical protein
LNQEDQSYHNSNPFFHQTWYGWHQQQQARLLHKNRHQPS